MKLCTFCDRYTAKPCITEAGTVGCRLKQKAEREREEERSMHVRFMAASDDWPRWPLLPLKFKGDFHRHGFLVAGKGATVHRGVIFRLELDGSPWSNYSREMYQDFTALFNAGWRVD